MPVQTTYGRPGPAPRPCQCCGGPVSDDAEEAVRCHGKVLCAECARAIADQFRALMTAD